MKRLLFLIGCSCLVGVSRASDIQWTRLRGKVKALNGKSQMITIENKEGDLMTLHVDPEIDVLKDNSPIQKLTDLKLEDKVTLLYNPKAPAPKDTDAPPEGGVYPALR